MNYHPAGNCVRHKVTIVWGAWRLCIMFSWHFFVSFKPTFDGIEIQKVALNETTSGCAYEEALNYSDYENYDIPDYTI